jgi:hypothetical protein
VPARRFHGDERLRTERTVAGSPFRISPSWVRFSETPSAGDLFGGEASTVPPPTPEQLQVLLLLVLAVRDIRLEGDPCCEGCVSDAWRELGRLEAAARLARAAFPGQHIKTTADLLLQALLGALRDYRQFLRQSPTKFMPRLGEPWDSGQREIALHSVTTVSNHAAIVLDRVKSLASPSTRGGL